jgi:membrane-associated phospholipid phosphatase
MPHSDTAWALFTRLGEAQILLPAMAAALLWLLRSPRTRPLAAAWLVSTSAAALLTLTTKVAFIGWEFGYAPWDFTGLSGHSMFAGAVWPVLARIAAGRAPRPWPRLAIAAGMLLAAGIALSRVVTGAHSHSEALLGLLIGLSASLLALRGTRAPQAPTPGWLAAALVAWLLALPLAAPPSRSHDLVTRLSLKLSGRGTPYTRGAMHRQAAVKPPRQMAGIVAGPLASDLHAGNELGAARSMEDFRPHRARQSASPTTAS